MQHIITEFLSNSPPAILIVSFSIVLTSAPSVAICLFMFVSEKDSFSDSFSWNLKETDINLKTMVEIRVDRLCKSL